MLGRKVKDHRDLHKDTWSLMAADGPERGRVIGYSDFDAEGVWPRFVWGARVRAVMDREDLLLRLKSQEHWVPADVKGFVRIGWKGDVRMLTMQVNQAPTALEFPMEGEWQGGEDFGLHLDYLKRAAVVHSGPGRDRAGGPDEGEEGGAASAGGGAHPGGGGGRGGAGVGGDAGEVGVNPVAAAAGGVGPVDVARP